MTQSEETTVKKSIMLNFNLEEYQLLLEFMRKHSYLSVPKYVKHLILTDIKKGFLVLGQNDKNETGPKEALNNNDLDI